MHVLIIPSWYPANKHDVAGVFFRDQALALLPEGHDVGVISVHKRSLLRIFQKNKNLVREENDRGVWTVREQIVEFLPRIPYGNYLIWKWTIFRAFKAYMKKYGKPDVLHAHVIIYGGSVAAELSRKYDIPLVITEHSSGFARNLYKPWQIKLAKHAVKNAHYHIAVSPKLGELLIKTFDLRKPVNWHWVPNIVADRFNLASTSSSSNLKRPFRFLNLAIMNENKGQITLLEAFAKMHKLNPNIELWLGGDGPQRNTLNNLVVGLGLGSKVKFLGMVKPESVPVLMADIEALVISSRYETFGVVAAESLMAGKPVVATKCGGPECIVREADGILVKPNDVNALMLGMMKLHDDYAKFDFKEIRESALIRFSSRAISQKLSSIYSRITEIDSSVS